MTGKTKFVAYCDDCMEIIVIDSVSFFDDSISDDEFLSISHNCGKQLQ